MHSDLKCPWCGEKYLKEENRETLEARQDYQDHMDTTCRPNMGFTLSKTARIAQELSR
jgi:hypothetical protein